MCIIFVYFLCNNISLIGTNFLKKFSCICILYNKSNSIIMFATRLQIASLIFSVEKNNHICLYQNDIPLRFEIYMQNFSTTFFMLFNFDEGIR